MSEHSHETSRSMETSLLPTAFSASHLTACPLSLRSALSSVNSETESAASRSILTLRPPTNHVKRVASPSPALDSAAQRKRTESPSRTRSLLEFSVRIGG